MAGADRGGGAAGLNRPHAEPPRRAAAVSYGVVRHAAPRHGRRHRDLHVRKRGVARPGAGGAGAAAGSRRLRRARRRQQQLAVDATGRGAPPGDPRDSAPALAGGAGPSPSRTSAIRSERSTGSWGREWSSTAMRSSRRARWSGRSSPIASGPARVGGDVGLALRLAATGRPLLYTPHCAIRHVIAPDRTTMPYLVRMAAGLGASQALAGALDSHRGRRGWLIAAIHDVPRTVRRLTSARGGCRAAATSTPTRRSWRATSQGCGGAGGASR